MSGLDIVTNDAGERVRRAHAVDLGEDVIVALHRLARLTRLHDIENQAFARQLDQTHKLVSDYCLRAGANLNVLFADRVVLIGGQLLKGSRAAYEAATDLGEILAWCGGAELTIARDITANELKAFADALSAAFRGRKGQGFVSPTPKIRLRQVSDAARFRGIDVERLPLDEKIVRTYASAVVVMRRFFDDLRAGRYLLPRRLKRVAQSLVDLSSGNTPAYLGVTEVRNQNHDDAGRAVNTAILAVATARQITSDRVLLAQIAMAAMMHDVARPRASGVVGRPGNSPIVARLSEDAEDRLPAGAGAVLTALGRVNDPTIRRSVLTYEALWLRRSASLGPVYRGTRPPTIHARIIAAARRYNDLVTPEPGLAPPSPESAIATMAREVREPQDQSILRMLVATLGVFPVGTLVKLSSGETAEVILGRSETAKLNQPRIRVLIDARGAVLPRPFEMDLSAPPRTMAGARIASVISTDGWAKANVPTAGPALIHDPDDEAEPEPAPAPPKSASPPLPLVEGDRALSPASVRTRPTVAPGKPRAGIQPSSQSPDPAATQQLLPELDSSTSPVSASVNQSLGWETDLRVSALSVPQQAPTPPAPVSPPPAPASQNRPAEEDHTVFQASPFAADFETPPSADEEDEAGTVFLVRDAASAQAHDTAGIAARAASEPTAQGTLARTPFVHVLVYVLDRVLTGTLVLRDPERREHGIFFDRGAPARLKTSHPVAQLGEELIAARQIMPGTIETIVAAARRENVLLGEFLVAHGIATQQAVIDALRAQIVHRMEWLAKLPGETEYEFYLDEDLLHLRGEPTVCEPLNAILCAMRSWNDHPRIVSNLMRLKDHPVMLHPNADISRLALTRAETVLVQRIRAQRLTLLELYDNSLATDRGISAILYMLLATRQLVVPGQAREPMTTPPHADVPPPPTPSMRPVAARPSRGANVQLDDADDISQSSYPSLDTSPSAVAQAMEADFHASPDSPRGSVPPPGPQPAVFGPPPAHLRKPIAIAGAPTDRQTTARGNLAATPLIHVLVYMLDHGASGTVVLREPDGSEHIVFFADGAPAKVRTAKSIAPLGELLVRSGALDADRLDEAVSTAREIEALLGEYLILDNLCTKDAVMQALEQQVVEKTIALANLPSETTYAFYRDVNLLSNWGGKDLFRANPLSVILATSRVWQDRRRMRGALHKIRDQRLLIHPDADLSHLAMTPNEQAVLKAIKTEDVTLRTLVDRHTMPDEEINSFIYALAITRQFGYRGQAKKPPMIASMAGTTRRRISEPTPASKVQVRPSGRSEIQAPENVSEPPSWNSARISAVPLPPDMSTSAAIPTPSAPPSASLREVPARTDTKSETSEAIERALQADDAYRQALDLMRKGNIGEAREHALRALALDTENPDYVAINAWLGALSNEPGAVDQAIARLTDTLRTSPYCQTALMFRAKLYRKSNRLSEALQDFETVLRLNPTNREATSEARILRHRLGR